MSFKTFISCALISAVLLLFIAPLGGYLGHNHKFAAAVIGYCVLTFAMLSRCRQENRFWTVLPITLPILLIYTPIHFYNFSSTLLSFPSFMAHFFGVAAGVLIFVIRSTQLRFLVSGLLLLLSFWVAFEGYSMWLTKLNFGTFTGRVSKTISPFTLYTLDGKAISDTPFKNKLVVLDFWNTGCGVCFEKFPKLEAASDRFRKTSAVEFYAVNIPIKRDSAGYARRIWQALPYSVPGLFSDNSQAEKLFGISVYPTTLILKNGTQIIYKGNIEGVEDVLEAELDAVKM